MATESSEGILLHLEPLFHIWRLNEANSVAQGDADSVISQYKKFLEEVVPQNKSKFLDSSHRVDQLYHGLLACSDDYSQLWSVVKIVLLLSRGQATVERGFSVNRQVDDDSLHSDTFCCRRVICDTVGGLLWWRVCHRHKHQGITPVMQLSMAQMPAWPRTKEKRCDEGHSDSKKRLWMTPITDIIAEHYRFLLFHIDYKWFDVNSRVRTIPEIHPIPDTDTRHLGC